MIKEHFQCDVCRNMGGGGGGEAPEEKPMAGDPKADAAYIQALINRPERLTWEEYKEKHKDQLNDRLGAGVEREQLEYRKMLDAERNSKVHARPRVCSRPPPPRMPHE